MGSPARKWEGLAALAPTAPAVLLLLFFFVLPVLYLVPQSLGRDAEGEVALYAVIARPIYRQALVHSVLLALFASAAAVLLAFPAAIFLARESRGRSLLRAGFALPLALSGVVIGFLIVAMLGQAGVLPQLLGAPRLAGTAYGLGGLLIGYLYFEVPRAVLTLEATLVKLDLKLFQAARTLGASPGQAAWRVLVPLGLPAVRSAFGVTVAASLGAFGVALILAARFPLLPVELYRAITGTLDDALAAAMAVALLLCTVATLLILAPTNRHD